jgi:hypothetical protein
MLSIGKVTGMRGIVSADPGRELFCSTSLEAFSVKALAVSLFYPHKKKSAGRLY